ncbi:MAG: sodium-dependent transporter [Candidatus Omnitrophica bacterium]|jgi:SNF family Na+-dependent transporter|nr:sodium-dependent transporter [Candidatus Omnitrophota bacterium]
MSKQRQRWGSNLGIILAVAGSAVGLGNFLRFPVKVAQNGGAAFMIPYFISLVLLGIPLMWIEWTIGRYGGGFEHSTTPGIFHTLWTKNRFIKYFGVIGIFGPMMIFIYYTYIESWCLAYSVFSIMGKYQNALTQNNMVNFLRAFQGLEANQYFNGLGWAYLFFTITFILNVVVVYYGIKGGIERLCKITMPLLFIFALLLTLRVLTLGIPDVTKPDWNVLNGLGFLWNPNLKVLKNAKIWLEAAGQVFFTFGVGIGIIVTYASYLKKADDVALSGLSAASTNELAEVILGGSIVIPATYAFFGPMGMNEIAQGGPFNLSFVTMPVILQHIPLNSLFGFLWFIMLFFAGVTSSVSMAQPPIAFLEDEFNLDRKKAAWIFSIIAFLLCQPVIFFLSKGLIAELDFWAGTFCLVLFATVETVIFAWIFGIDKAWDEMHYGAKMRIPRIYKFIIKYITPLFLFIILGCWFKQEWLTTIRMENITPADKPFIMITRIVLLIIFLLLCLLIKLAWRKRKMSTYH